MTIHEILRKYWSYTSFRPLQQEIIEAVLAGNDTLALLPTSAGKSICFQVPAMVMEGICIVVTPLIALMKNQVENLKKRSIKAVAIHAGMHFREIDTLLDNCVYGNVKFLYVSPERLSSPLLLERVKLMNVSLLAIDEAHCISQWGYDFRPAYLKITEFKSKIPQAKIIALTASATDEVSNDIAEKLALNNPKYFRLSFTRPNISYSVFETEDKDQKLLDILSKVKGTNIIYVRSRKRAKNTTDWLNSKGFSTDYYHAGLNLDQRTAKQNDWISGKTNTIVATNAFGMGIDKSNVRLVVHIDIPESLEAYYQEAGRAGRDEAKAYAVMLYNKNDCENLLTIIESSYPQIDYLKRVYQMLANYFQIPVGGAEGESYPFNQLEFINNFGLKSTELHHALKLLQDEGFILLNEAFENPSQMQIIVDNNVLYNFRIKNERYDLFLKLILRIYGGEIFTDITKISEFSIAKYFLIPYSEVVIMLENLHNQNIIFYQKQLQLPYITFLTARYNSQQLPINEKNINFRKNRDFEKAHSVIKYATNTDFCRNKLILEYFNEKVEENCGNCDVCIQNRKTQKNKNNELRKYKSQIFELIKASNMTPDQLKNTLIPKNEKLFIEGIKILIEENLIQYDHLDCLILRK